MAETARPTTMAAVYSRALDEQERLRAVCTRLGVRETLASYDRAQFAVRSLAGDAGYVSRIVCELLEQASPDVPNVTLEPDHLIAPTAFLLLQQPFALTPPHLTGQDRVQAVAYSWLTLPPDGDDRGRIALIAWTTPLNQTTVLSTVPLVVATWPFGLTWQAAADQHAPDDATERIDLTALRWLAALNAFCEQRLITSERGRPERATRRRMERSGREPSDVLVVELRRVDHQRAEASGSGRDWSCSWLVSGHWRRQWHASVQTHRAIWIAPYVKGNLGAPLRARRRVFAVVN